MAEDILSSCLAQFTLEETKPSGKATRLLVHHNDHIERKHPFIMIQYLNGVRGHFVFHENIHTSYSCSFWNGVWSWGCASVPQQYIDIVNELTNSISAQKPKTIKQPKKESEYKNASK